MAVFGQLRNAQFDFWRSIPLSFRPFPALALVASLLTSGCVVGPNFKPPAAPPVSTYTQQPQPQTTVAAPGVPAGNAQHLVYAADIPADWWTLFHSAALNDLIAQALAHNADLKAAQAALRARDQRNRRPRRDRPSTAASAAVNGGPAASASIAEPAPAAAPATEAPADATAETAVVEAPATEAPAVETAATDAPADTASPAPEGA
jgi:outer membrane protein TolC